MAQNQYAFGDDSVHNTPCVAMAHGGDLSGELLNVAETYDELAQERFDSDKGTITVSTAEELWNEAIDKIRARLNVERDDEHARYLRRAIDQAEDIADQAF